MKIEVTLHELMIKDTQTGEEYTIKTLRSAREIAEEIEQSEKDHVVFVLEEKVSRAY